MSDNATATDTSASEEQPAAVAVESMAPVVAQVAEPVASAPVEARAASVVEPAPAPVPAAAPPAPFVLPTDSLAQLAQAAGLEWVQSDEEKVRTVQAAIAAEPKSVHVPREIVRIVLPDEGPLVLVETRRDLADVKLPFEQAAG